MSRLITTSLQSSIDWYKICPPSWKARALTSLKNTLGRVWDEPNEFAKLGIKFEKCLYEAIRSTKNSGSEKFQAIVKRYKAYEFYEIQKTIKRFITLGKIEYCLYGKLDIYCGEFNEDIKTTSKLMDDYSKKYLKTFQHHLYCYITEIPLFKYFIVAFNENTQQIHSTQEIIYESPSMDAERKIVEDEIRKIFVFFNSNPKLGTLYNEKYCLY